MSTGVYNFQDFQTSSPEIFYGNGITLYEVCARDIPSHAVLFMFAMFDSFFKARGDFTEMDHTGMYETLPAQPRICGGLVEFRFLSYE